MGSPHPERPACSGRIARAPLRCQLGGGGLRDFWGPVTELKSWMATNLQVINTGEIFYFFAKEKRNARIRCIRNRMLPKPKPARAEVEDVIATAIEAPAAARKLADSTFT